MPCNCGTTCTCPSVAVAPAIIAEPGPATVITADLTILPAGDPASVSVSGVPPNEHLQFLLPAAPSPVFDSNVPVTQLLPGDPATASIDNTNPLAPILSLGLAPGQDGADGKSPWSPLSATFVMPAIDAIALVVVPDTSFLELGSWVYMQGAGTFAPYGGWLVVAGLLNSTQAFLRNPGPTDGVSASGVPGNVTAGTNVTASGSANQLIVSGRMGPAGTNGDPGPVAVVTQVYTIPVSAPASPELGTVLYYDAAPPSAPTIARFYTWNGASWDGGPNIVGTAGSFTFFGTADPNVTPPAGSKVGDNYVRFTTPYMTEYYFRVSGVTWVAQGSISLLGTETTSYTHTSPGTYTVDLSVFSYFIDANKDIELAYDSVPYEGQGNWTIVLYNSDAGSIDLTFSTGAWEADPALSITPPVTIAAGDTYIIRFVRNSNTGLYCITNFFATAAL